jgi:hypothetical protein
MNIDRSIIDGWQEYRGVADITVDARPVIK